MSVLSYPLLQVARTRQWCRFVGSSPHEFKAQLRGQLTSVRNSYNSLASLESAEGGRDLPNGTGENGLHTHVSEQILLGEDLSEPVAFRVQEDAASGESSPLISH